MVTADLTVAVADEVVSTDAAARRGGVTQDAVYTPPPTSAIGRALANPNAKAILIRLAVRLAGEAVEHGALALYKRGTREAAGTVEMVYAEPPRLPALVQPAPAPPRVETTATGKREPTRAPPLPPLVPR